MHTFLKMSEENLMQKPENVLLWAMAMKPKDTDCMTQVSKRFSIVGYAFQ